MEEKSQKIINIIIFFIIILVFRTWFISLEIIGGDWPYFYQTMIRSFHYLPPIWSQVHGNGLGGTILSYGIDTYLYFTGTIFSNILGIPWSITYKIVWFGLFIVLSFLGSSLLYKKTTTSKNNIFAGISGLIYTTNTYILMVVGGGQMGVAFSYSILPFVLYFLLSSLDSLVENKSKLIINVIYLSIFLALEALFDPRIAYLSLGLIFLLIISKLINRQKLKLKILLLFKMLAMLLPVTLLVFFLSAFWLLPLALVQNITSDSLGVSSSIHEVLKFYSFAKFENTLSLLHPNWPENVFGKVAFMRPEFLLLPILAFLPLVLTKEKNRTVLLLSLISIVGFFLAKGNNPPLGFVYEFLFSHVPGFFVFRDPTKFYFLTALSFAILIPLGLEALTALLVKNKKSQSFLIKYIPITAFLLLWSYLSLPALTGALGGTLKQHYSVKEYKELSIYIDRQPEFFRTLWIPRQSRLAAPVSLHPTVEALPLLKATNAAELKSILEKKGTQEYLSELAIKYLVLPYDAYGEIFLDDRKYSSNKREEYKKVLESIHWLKNIRDDNLVVYKLQQNPKGLFYTNVEEKVSYKKISDVEYRVSINKNTHSDLFFSQNYHPLWIAYYSGHSINPIRTEKGLMKYAFPSDAKEITLLFQGKNIYEKSLWLSIVTLLSLVLTLVVLKLTSSNSRSKNYEKK